MSDINTNLQKRQTTGAILIDLEKAFDSVWLDGLIYKLIKKKFPTHLIKTIWNMIHGKKFIVNNENLSSNLTFTIQEGVQQGIMNSLILFSIYTYDILVMFEMNKTEEKTSIAFADDMIIYIIRKLTQISSNKN